MNLEDIVAHLDMSYTNRAFVHDVSDVIQAIGITPNHCKLLRAEFEQKLKKFWATTPKFRNGTHYGIGVYVFEGKPVLMGNRTSPNSREHITVLDCTVLDRLRKYALEHMELEDETASWPEDVPTGDDLHLDYSPVVSAAVKRMDDGNKRFIALPCPNTHADIMAKVEAWGFPALDAYEHGYVLANGRYANPTMAAMCAKKHNQTLNPATFFKE
jgi:hypothetical protein